MVLSSEEQGSSIGRGIDIKRPSKSPLKGDLEGDRCPPHLRETGEKRLRKEKSHTPKEFTRNEEGVECLY